MVLYLSGIRSCIRGDLILLDYEMPIANGPQVLSMLKNDSETGQIPVMFLRGHGDRKSVLSVVELSPVDYLLKTIDRETLLQKLDDFFRERAYKTHFRYAYVYREQCQPFRIYMEGKMIG